MTAVTYPAKGLPEEVGRFLTGYHFITWSEVRFRLDNEDLDAAINVRSNLESWLSLLPPNARDIICLSRYFELPYIYIYIRHSHVFTTKKVVTKCFHCFVKLDWAIIGA